MLLIAFGSVVAAGLPLAIALVGLGISSAGLIALLAHVLDVPDWTTAVSGLIGIGVGIDYSLLVLTRFRAAMAEGKDRHDAVVEAVTTAGRSAIIAGCTVVIAVLGLVLTGLDVHVRGRDLDLARGAGRDARLDHPAARAALLPRTEGGPAAHPASSAAASRLKADGDSLAARWSHAVQRRPWTAAILATVVLLALAAPALGMRLGFPDAGNDPPDTMTRQAYDLNAEGFGPGVNGPLVIAAAMPGPAAKPKVETFAKQLRSEPGIQFVAPPRINAAGNAAIVTVIPTGSPQDKETEDLVNRLRDDVIPRDLGGHGHPRRGRRRHRCARGPERVHEGTDAAVHHRRGRAVLPAPPGRLPLAADLAEGGDHEPALGQRRLRRDDAGLARAARSGG